MQGSGTRPTLLREMAAAAHGRASARDNSSVLVGSSPGQSRLCESASRCFILTNRPGGRVCPLDEGPMTGGGWLRRNGPASGGRARLLEGL